MNIWRQPVAKRDANTATESSEFSACCFLPRQANSSLQDFKTPHPTQADRDTDMLTGCVMLTQPIPWNMTLPPLTSRHPPPLVWLNGPNSPDSRRAGGERR